MGAIKNSASNANNSVSNTSKHTTNTTNNTAKILVIAEKPSVGISLAAVLGARDRKDGYVEGNGYIVSWCVGHLVGLADAYEYDEKYGKWKREDLPIIPSDITGQTGGIDAWKYLIFDGKQKQFNTLKSLMNRPGVESLICATDAGREGELIFRFVYHMAGCEKPFSRLWISSMEESAIRAGFDNLKCGSEYDPLYYSAICRAKADWLIGINATRLFSTLYNKTLNVGRVQIPTLAMLAERQDKIAGFVKEEFYKVRLDIDTGNAEDADPVSETNSTSNTANTNNMRNTGGGIITAQSQNITNPQEATTIQTACHNRQVVLTSITKEQKSISPPKLFDLTTLQRESNRLFGYTAQETLNAAQRLYEAKLITYPRTDSKYLTADMVDGVPALVQSAAVFAGVGGVSGVGGGVDGVSGNDGAGGIDTSTHTDTTTNTHNTPNLPINTDQIINNAKVSDHHAIIPTAQLLKFDVTKLSDKERNILALIAIRLVCAVGDKHIYEAITAVFDCNGYSFTAKGRVTISEGWRLIASATYKEDGNDPDNNTLPPITEGQTFTNTTTTITDHYTQPPKSYTEDTLLSAMENAGADDTTGEATPTNKATSKNNNPSNHHNQSPQAERQPERKGLGTPATRAAVIEKLVNGGFIKRSGRQLIPTTDGENLIKILPDNLKSPALTAEWENALSLIAKGEADPNIFMRDIEDMARALVTGNPTPYEEYKNLFGTPKEAIGICPRCKNNVLESKKNFHCENRDCLFVMWKADRFFTSRKKELSKATATELLKDGRAKIKGLYSEKKNKTFDAVVLLADTGGKYVNYKFDFGGQSTTPQ